VVLAMFAPIQIDLTAGSATVDPTRWCHLLSFEKSHNAHTDVPKFETQCALYRLCKVRCCDYKSYTVTINAILSVAH